MKCQQAKILISSFIDGELTNSEWQQVQSHVESCSTCSRILAMFEESTALFKREMTEHRPVADLWSHIVERISEEKRPSVFEVLKDKLKEFTLTFMLRPSPKIRYTQLSFAIIAIVAVFALFRRAPSTSDFIVEEKRSTRLALARDTNRHQYLQANVLKQVEKYFDRAGVLLLEVKNGTIDPQEDAINQVRQSSQKLLEETILVKENIKKSDAVRLKKIIEQLEVVLYEIANLNDEPENDEIGFLRAAILQNDLLIKIEVYDAIELKRQVKRLSTTRKSDSRKHGRNIEL